MKIFKVLEIAIGKSMVEFITYILFFFLTSNCCGSNSFPQTCSFSERYFVCEPYCIWEAGRAAWPVTVAHWLDKSRVLTTLLVSYASGAQRPPRTERIREGWGQVIVIRRATWKFTSCFISVDSKVKDKVLYNWTQILHKAVDSLSLCQAVICVDIRMQIHACTCTHVHMYTHTHTHTHTKHRPS